MSPNGGHNYPPGGGQRPGQGGANRPGGNWGGNQPPPPPPLDVKSAVVSGIDPKFIETAEQFSGRMAASNTQVRNIFTAIMRLKAQEDLSVPKMLMLLPRLTYAVGRDSTLKPLKDSLGPAISFVAQENNPQKRKELYDRFCDCCEAIIGFMPRKQQRR